MNARPILHFGACARCAHGSADGLRCHRPPLGQPTAQARGPAGFCGPGAVHHLYRAPAPEAPPLLAAA